MNVQQIRKWRRLRNSLQAAARREVCVCGEASAHDPGEVCLKHYLEGAAQRILEKIQADNEHPVPNPASSPERPFTVDDTRTLAEKIKDKKALLKIAETDLRATERRARSLTKLVAEFKYELTNLQSKD